MDGLNNARKHFARYMSVQRHNRDNVLNNRGVLFQTLAWQSAIFTALSKSELVPETTTVLDVGCGAGNSIAPLIFVGFDPERIHGIDLIPDNVEKARKRFPSSHFTLEDASDIRYPEGTFDLVLESTMFVEVSDPALSAKIASEMMRVLKPGGHAMLIDWRYSHPGSETFCALSSRRIKTLFPQLSRIAAFPGALLPPIGRPLSKYAPILYFPVQKCLPWLVGQYVWLLRKPGIAAGDVASIA